MTKIGEEKAGTGFVPVRLGGTGGQAANATDTVAYATPAGPATAGSDYTSSSGTLTFAPGETAKTVVVPIADDGTAESSESFTLSLSNPTNADLATGTGTVSIGASDAAAGSQPRILAPTDAIIGEGDGYVDLMVRLSQPGSNPVSVHYAAANSAPHARTACNYHHLLPSGTLNFAPGETTKVVRVQILDCPPDSGLKASTFNLG